ncbi:hypothetical protein FVEG_15391 [Fusarium verticillioides 7600]|uniref:Uncharacterized protein n=1 Tax=Gibberella moniliformis (strain M3125 / FGSC 7600) TaxID=334819 RepID=W7M3I4_GIBM7|nr:hypothetical protein FVEG_15391 [Fusarium verticillioides 7600]EWG42115.1 hypothetical protein FVEG_15391 [Fusarium verticillioides 7600]
MSVWSKPRTIRSLGLTGGALISISMSISIVLILTALRSMSSSEHIVRLFTQRKSCGIADQSVYSTHSDNAIHKMPRPYSKCASILLSLMSSLVLVPGNCPIRY